MRTFGYILSILSAILLAVPAWKSGQPTLLLLLIAGTATSIGGFVARFIRDDVLNEESKISP